MDVAHETLGCAVGDLDEPVVDFGEPGRVEGVGEEVEGAGLIRGFEDVGHVGEEDVVEEVAELFPSVSGMFRGVLERDVPGCG